jgi:hypothetical protein
MRQLLAHGTVRQTPRPPADRWLHAAAVLSKKLMIKKTDGTKGGLDNIQLFCTLTILSAILLLPVTLALEGWQMTPAGLAAHVRSETSSRRQPRCMPACRQGLADWLAGIRAQPAARRSFHARVPKPNPLWSCRRLSFLQGVTDPGKVLGWAAVSGLCFHTYQQVPAHHPQHRPPPAAPTTRCSERSADVPVKAPRRSAASYDVRPFAS